MLKEMRNGAGLTQRQLAAKLDREQNFVNRLEMGERRLDLVEFYWYCKACNANPEVSARELMRNFEQIENPTSTGGLPDIVSQTKRRKSSIPKKRRPTQK